MHAQHINLPNIKIVASRKGLSIKDLAEKIGFTYVGLQKIIRENTTTLQTMQKIAFTLDVPVQLFFLPTDQLDDGLDITLEKFLAYKKENAELKLEIDELKNKIIRLADML